MYFLQLCGAALRYLDSLNSMQAVRNESVPSFSMGVWNGGLPSDFGVWLRCDSDHFRGLQMWTFGGKEPWDAAVSITGWWFGTFFIFPYIGNNHPNWLIFFQRGSNHQPDKYQFLKEWNTFPLPCFPSVELQPEVLGQRTTLKLELLYEAKDGDVRGLGDPGWEWWLWHSPTVDGQVCQIVCVFFGELATARSHTLSHSCWIIGLQP